MSGRGPTKVLSIRLTLEEAQTLDSQAEELGLSRSGLVALLATRRRSHCPLCHRTKEIQKLKAQARRAKA